MNGTKQFTLALVGAIVVLLAAEVAVVKVVGGRGLSALPVVGDFFTVVEAPEVLTEPQDERCDEIGRILAKLKAREAREAEREDQLDQLRTLKADLEEIEQRNRLLFERLAELYPIIETSRRETLKVLAKKYERTSPETVAQIFDGMSDRECAELLLVMSDRAAAKVLEAFAKMGDLLVEEEYNRKRATKINQLMRNTLLLSDENAKLFTPP